ncbi:MAG: nucleotide exchange factor GrpE [Candidatus Cloacimonadota bacterium]|nr:nucleotide exchange factor GrpE [Candidatus Cloacimonadota bacterium]
MKSKQKLNTEEVQEKEQKDNQKLELEVEENQAEEKVSNLEAEKEIKDSEEKEEEKELTLEEKYAELEKERDSFKDKWIRKAAEFENFRKRSNKEKQDWIKNANKRIILEVCDVMDDFERAIKTESKNHQLDTLRKGVDMIFDKLVNIIKKEGVEQIDALEKEFDPNYHEALAHIASDKEKDIIAAIIRNGYLMNNKVLRPTQVAVSNGEKPKKTKK